LIIKHRVNAIQELKEVPKKYGVEIDLRLYMGEVVLSHNPFEGGDKFKMWLDHFQHKTLILNVKEDGLEDFIVGTLRDRGISDYFFLDQPFPTLRKSIIAGLPTALRLSEYENPINLEDLKPDWIWLDSFTGNWSYLEKHSEWLRTEKVKLCIVSPELQGRLNTHEAQSIIDLMGKLNLRIDAACTKFPDVWEEAIR
jgi:hypothetical protein